MLARQVLHHLSLQPFLLWYFGNWVILFAQASLDCNPPISGFLP
jgi:hypothetical protein